MDSSIRKKSELNYKKGNGFNHKKGGEIDCHYKKGQCDYYYKKNGKWAIWFTIIRKMGEERLEKWLLL